MHDPDERSELIRAVTKRGEAVAVVAARLGVSVSTAYRWIRSAAAGSLPPSMPMFVEVRPSRAASSALVVRVGVAEIEVRAGFDARLLREVIAVLGEES